MLRSLLAALALIPSVAFAQLGGGETVARANVRLRPSSTAPVVVVLPARAEVTVQERSAEWYRVSSDRANGWVHRSLVKLAPAAVQPEERVVPDTTLEVEKETPAPAPAPRPAAELRPSATAGAPRRDKEAAATGGFENDHNYIGVRTWLGVFGTLSVGGSVERPITKPGQYGPGIISASAAVDFYRYSTNIGGLASWSTTVIPIAGFATYHFPLKNRKLDPYAGVGLGYYMVSVSGRTYTGDEYRGSARASTLFLAGQLGARYYVRPNLAVQAETGLGMGALSLGVNWKM